MTTFGVVAGFGSPLGAQQLAQIASIPPLTSVRQDVPLGRDPRPLIVEFTTTPLVPLFLVRFPDVPTFVSVALSALGQRWGMELYDPADVSSEPNGLIDPVAFSRSVTHAYTLARGMGFRGNIYSGAISNINDGALAWLTVMQRGLPADVIRAVHYYPPARAWGQTVYGSRDALWAKLSSVIGPSRYAITEVGFDGAVHTVPWYQSWFGLFGSDWQRGVLEIGSDLVLELQYWHRHNAESVYLYQWNDGPSASPIDHFGLRYADGHPKVAVIAALKRWATVPA